MGHCSCKRRERRVLPHESVGAHQGHRRLVEMLGELGIEKLDHCRLRAVVHGLLVQLYRAPEEEFGHLVLRPQLADPVSPDRVVPGASIGTMKTLIPACFVPSPSVRAASQQYSLDSAPLVQILLPLMM